MPATVLHRCPRWKSSCAHRGLPRQRRPRQQRQLTRRQRRQLRQRQLRIHRQRRQQPQQQLRIHRQLRLLRQQQLRIRRQQHQLRQQQLRIRRQRRQQLRIHPQLRQLELLAFRRGLLRRRDRGRRRLLVRRPDFEACLALALALGEAGDHCGTALSGSGGARASGSSHCLPAVCGKVLFTREDLRSWKCDASSHRFQSWSKSRKRREDAHAVRRSGSYRTKRKASRRFNQSRGACRIRG